MNKTIIIALKVIVKALNNLIRLLEKEPQPKPETIEEMIRRVANYFDVDPDLAVKVARCESNLDPKAININPKGSKDRGLYQWNSYWHPEITDEMAYDPEKATRLFCIAVKAGHLNWWNATRECWSK